MHRVQVVEGPQGGTRIVAAHLDINNLALQPLRFHNNTPLISKVQMSSTVDEFLGPYSKCVCVKEIGKLGCTGLTPV